MLRIRLRVDGVLHEQIIEAERIASALVTRLKLMCGLDISEKRLPQDGRFSIRVKEKALDVRLATMPVQFGEAMVMRLLDQSASHMPLSELGMSERIAERVKLLMTRSTGMILVTGPTGSGKTTTLYSAIHQVNEPGRKIITVEDPVEYRLPRVNQVQVNVRIGLTFARILRTALRQDPDIILVGEMRDQETAEIGLRAAMTGHLVLSTLHTNDALSTIERLLDMGPPAYIIAASLDAILAQRLVRRICDVCAADDDLEPQQQAWLASMVGEDEIASMRLRRGVGCAYCSNTGYRGRIGVYELLEMNDALVEAMRREDLAAFAEIVRADTEFRPLVRAALDIAAVGTTSLEEVMRLAGGAAEFLDPSLDADTGAASTGGEPEAPGD